jgi:hypothetical protein
MLFTPGQITRHVAILVIAISAAISGCAATYNSGIQEKGPGTYFLSVRLPSVDGGGTESRRQAGAQADEYCAKSGKVAEVTTEEVGPVTADIYFVCS